MSNRGTINQPFLLLLAVVLCLGAVGIAIWRWDHRETADDRTERMADDAQKVFATFGYVQLTEIQDVSGFLSEHAVAGPRADLPNSNQRQSLFQAVAEFLAMRFGQDDPLAYLEWRRSHGAQLRPAAELREEYSRTYTLSLGVTGVTPDITAEEFFSDLWNAFRDLREGGNYVDGLPASPQSTFVSFALMRDGRTGRPVHSDEQGHMILWHGGIAIGVNRLTVATPTVEERTETSPVLGGFVTTAVKYADGVPRPTTWSFFWDEQLGKWVLFYTTLNNAVGKDVRTPDV